MSGENVSPNGQVPPNVPAPGTLMAGTSHDDRLPEFPGITGPHGSDAKELRALFEAGGFWRLAPEWVPRTGYAGPTRPLLKRVEAGLEKAVAAHTAKTPAMATGPTSGPVPVDGCRICSAAAKRRESTGLAGIVRASHQVISRHPHRRVGDAKWVKG